MELLVPEENSEALYMSLNEKVLEMPLDSELTFLHIISREC